MSDSLLSRFERPVPTPGRVETCDDTIVTWDATAVRIQRVDASELVLDASSPMTMRVSRSRHEARSATGRAVEALHVEIVADGRRVLRLHAVVAPSDAGLLDGLPWLEAGGDPVDVAALVSLACAAVALGAELARWDPADAAPREAGERRRIPFWATHVVRAGGREAVEGFWAGVVALQSVAVAFLVLDVDWDPVFVVCGLPLLISWLVALFLGWRPGRRRLRLLREGRLRIAPRIAQEVVREHSKTTLVARFAYEVGGRRLEHTARRTPDRTFAEREGLLVDPRDPMRAVLVADCGVIIELVDDVPGGLRVVSRWWYPLAGVLVWLALASLGASAALLGWRWSG